MVGNAVPPRLAWYLAIQMRKAFADIMPQFNGNTKDNRSLVKQITVQTLIGKYPQNIIENQELMISHDSIEHDIDKRVLISYVKADNVGHYIDKSAKIYYTGRKFPSTIDLNMLYYFMPYLKGKGVRDLYIIKMVRIGSKLEVHQGCTNNDCRLVFEIEYVKQLFDEYMPVHLNIMHTFTDTTMRELLKIRESRSD